MISINIVFENPDGSADAVLDCDEAGMQIIVQYGLIALLKEGLKYNYDHQEEE